MDTTLPAPRPLRRQPRRRRASANVRRATALARDRRARAGRADASPPGQDRQSRRPARPDRRRALARPWRRAILARAQWPAGNARRRRPTAIPAPRWTPDERLADRPGAGLCPCPPGKQFPRRGGQPGGRGRADAGPPRHRRRHGARRAATPSARTCSSAPRPTSNMARPIIELIRRIGATRGQLPKVIAAYNAGPVPVDRWNYINDKRRSAAVDRKHPLLGNALLRARRAAQHVGIPGARRRAAADAARAWPSIAGRPSRPSRQAARPQ